jgi:hypothetical protein
MNNTFCYKCHIPKTKENYFEDKNNKTGLKSYCKDCCNKYKAEKITYEYCNYTRRRDSYYRHLKSKKHISNVPQPYNPTERFVRNVILINLFTAFMLIKLKKHYSSLIHIDVINKHTSYKKSYSNSNWFKHTDWQKHKILYTSTKKLRSTQ